MRKWLTVVFVCLALPVWAQATVAVFPASATDPNTAMPVAAPVSYTPTCGKTPKLTETPPIVNPNIGRYDDPANAALDCEVGLSGQMASLAKDTPFKAALKLGAANYGPLSTTFTMSAAQPAHPCDNTPTSPSAIVGQAFTLGWCHAVVATGSSPAVTSWRIYRNGTLLSGTTVTVGATANAAGLFYMTIPRTESASGTVNYEVSAVNSVGESTKSPVLTITVNPASTVPGPPGRGRITVP